MTHLTNTSLLSSWERSKKYGASLNKAKDAILGARELKVHQEKKESFIQQLYPTIEQLALSLKASNSVVSLSNSSGILLQTMGDPTFLKETEKIYLKAGACWSEEVRGTNSAGTISVEKKPIAVVGDDHYLKSHHMLYCVGSPIFNPTGELQAVLNISGHAHLYHPSMLGMVDIIARKIENWMLIQRPQKQIIISLHHEAQNKFDALLAVNEDGEIIGANREARELLPIAQQNKAIYLSDFFAQPEKLLEQNSQSMFNLDIVHTESQTNKRLIASVILNSHPKTVRFTNKQSTQATFPYHKREKNQAFTHIYGNDQDFLEALDTAKKVAPTDYTVVITGESGTGKDMVSQAIHRASLRADKPYIALNCGGITKSLAESELFGYESGAFTGAKQSGHPGVFERADGGTLFLDEIAELPMDIQATLLRVLQDFKVMRIGGTKPVEVNVRLITATHTDLWEKVQEGTFRADLFFRLQGVHIHLPPLRKRADRLQYAELFLQQIKAELNQPSLVFSETAERLITNYSWPGNVRQLSSALREAAFSAGDGMIDAKHFPTYITSRVNDFESTGSLLQDTENKIIMKTLNQTKGNISEAARILGIGRNTLYRKLEKLQFPFDDD